MTTQLTAEHGDLEANGHLLIVRYRYDDIDTIPWPFDHDKWAVKLAGALYDAYECGLIFERTVLLPDGTEFCIDDHVR